MADEVYATDEEASSHSSSYYSWPMKYMRRMRR
jgi:hypothetical protein